jgi:drug/metabolite transporter (DMT)-like permease
MGRLENLPEQNGANPASEEQTADAVLRSVTQNLRSLQQDLLMQLNQDINRLQAEKSRLVNDIEKLQTQQQNLQSQQEVDLSRQQLAQQQAWAKQLALVLANHLQTALNERLNQTLGVYQAGLPPQLPADMSQLVPTQPAPLQQIQSQQVMASLDDTVNRAFASLRHDINSYQSSLGQQLERMHTMGQQGEAILEVLVKRLSQQLQTEVRGRAEASPLAPTIPPPAIAPSAPSRAAIPPAGKSPAVNPAASELPSAVQPPSGFGLPSQPTPAPSWTDALRSSSSQVAQASAPPLEFAGAEAEEFEISAAETNRSVRPRRVVSARMGLGLVLSATFVMALHYVMVGVVGNVSQLFGQQSFGGYLSLNHFSNGALLLWVRMLVVLPLMVPLSTYLHPPTLRDLRAFTRSQDRRAVWGVVGSGIFLFLSQVFLYIAIGQLGPGVAITALFVYPVGVLALNMLLFAEKISLNRIGIIAAILVGAGLALSPLLGVVTAQAGILAAVLSALLFTFYLVAMQIGARKLHPVPTSLIQFATLFVLGSLSLIVYGIQGNVNWAPLLLWGVILGVLTLGSYVLNHFGVRAIGAARSSIIASSTPALTALLGFFLVPGALTTLNLMQIAGILIVTLGGTALGLERMLLHSKTTRQPKPREEVEEVRQS